MGLGLGTANWARNETADVTCVDMPSPVFIMKCTQRLFSCPPLHLIEREEYQLEIL